MLALNGQINFVLSAVDNQVRKSGGKFFLKHWFFCGRNQQGRNCPTQYR
jgi:hypothetical protein